MPKREDPEDIISDRTFGQEPEFDFADQIAADFDEGVGGSALRRWWMDTAAAEVDPMIAKMIEYGGGGRALDLEEIGRGLVHSGVKINTIYSEQELTGRYQELGIYFYLLGKFARWTAAVAEGRPVSDDTLHDIGIYVRMAQRVRAVGGWPV